MVVPSDLSKDADLINRHHSVSLEREGYHDFMRGLADRRTVSTYMLIGYRPRTGDPSTMPSVWDVNDGCESFIA